MSLPELFRRVSFHVLPGWHDDDPSAALAAFARSAVRSQSKPYRTGSFGIRTESLAEAGARAASLKHPVSPFEAQAFFERYFVPFHVRSEEGGQGFVTGYFEPEAAASHMRTQVFRFPLHRRPEDLADVDGLNRPAGWDANLAFARRQGEKLLPYHDREAIERGALDGRGLELCWLADRIDAFFIHVQGAARLTLPGGEVLRVTYAAKSGHPFTGIGRVLAELGEIPLEEVSMQSIKAWLADHPHRQSEILWKNRSYIFFRKSPPCDPELGPIAAAKVQLQPGRSLAVDRLLHTFGTPFFIDAPGLRHLDGRPFRRLMIAQDTGSAITGAARGDLFIGTGKAAGEAAGTIRHEANFFALLPRSVAEAISI
ncbi:murein transglycosylase A [Chelativorans sp. Marseille-P2723]|uniref:murein transglycosylase A n=1 Tax=Chelativorans sp. Marseille-P2723 TaxID=2709133 RepID=UPI001FF03868|nr:murein transglycosylase A [Chelativorans sp. Marseille-P2723]